MKNIFMNETFAKNELEISKDNLSFYSLYNKIMAGFMLVLFLSTWLTDYFVGLRYTYAVVGLVSVFGIILLKWIVPWNIRSARLALCTGFLKTYAFCLMTSVVFNTDGPAITFYIFLLLLSVTFVMPMIVMALVQVAAVTVFCTMTILMKPWEIAQGDVMSAVCFLAISLFLAYKTSNDRIMKVDTTAKIRDTKKKLEEEYQKYESLIRSIPGGVGIFEVGSDIRPVFANEKVGRMFGADITKLEECTFEDMMEVLHPSDREKVHTDILLTTQNRQNFEGTYRTNPVDGVYRWIHVRGTWMNDNEAGNPMYSVVFVDVDRDKRQEERQRQEMLTNNLAYYKLNLSEDKVIEQKSNDDTDNYLQEATTIDELGEKIKEHIIDARGRAEYTRIMNRQTLIDCYQKGKTQLALEVQYRVAEDEVLWLRIHTNISENRQTQMLEAFIYISDISEDKINEQLLQNVSRQNYDYVMVIDQSQKTYKLHSSGQNNHVALPPEDGDYPILSQLYCQTYVVEQQRAQACEEIQLSHIEEQLSMKDVYVTYVDIIGVDKRVHKKQIQCSYIDRVMGQILLTIADITDIVNKELKDKEELEQALNTAKAASAAKQEFVEHMTREMSVPLQGVVDMLAEWNGKKEATQEKSDPVLSRANLYATHLNSIMTDMLEIMKSGGNQISLNQKPVERMEFIDKILIIVQPLADILEVQLECDFGTPVFDKVYVDEPRMRQILMNTIIGAIHNTRKGNTVTFSSRYAKVSVDHMRVKYQVINEDDRMPERPGETITKNLVTLMNGSYSVDEQNGRSVVTIEVEMEGAI